MNERIQEMKNEFKTAGLLNRRLYISFVCLRASHIFINLKALHFTTLYYYYFIIVINVGYIKCMRILTRNYKMVTFTSYV